MADVKRRAIRSLGSHQPIKHLEIADLFKGVYYLEQMSIKVARNGSKYSDLVLKDKSGSSFAKFWGTLTKTKKGMFVAVEGHVDEYMGKPSVIVDKIKEVEPPTDLSDYLAQSLSLESDKFLFSDFIQRIDGLGVEIQDETCEQLIDVIFTEEFKKQFFEAPYSILPHYATRGGLLEHTIKVAGISSDAASRCGLSSDEKVVLYTACLLHGIGAIEALEFQDCVARETKSGVLLGKTFLSSRMIQKAVEGLENLNQELLVRILHAVLSHEATSIKPMTREAIILAEACRTDMRIVEASDFIEQDLNDDEFTAFDTLSQRRFYKGPKIK